MEVKEGIVSGKGSRRDWKPKSSGTSGEIAMMKALQDAKILYRSQVPLKTRFKEYPFLVDFLIPSIDVKQYLGLCVEVDGALHRKTWTGKPAVRRMAKDDAKDECLIGEGYRVLRIRDDLVKRDPEEAIRQIREELAR